MYGLASKGAGLGLVLGLKNLALTRSLLRRSIAGAFLIPYVIMMAIVGLPVFLLELIFGQYYAGGPINITRNVSPLFRGK